MKKLLENYFFIGTILFCSLIIAGCERQGTLERAGEKADEAVEDAHNKVEDAGDRIEDATDGTN